MHIRLALVIRALALCGVLFAMAPLSSAQISAMMPTRRPLKAGDQLVSLDGTPIVLKNGDKVRYRDREYVIGPSTFSDPPSQGAPEVLPNDTVVVDGKTYLVPSSKGAYGVVGAFPLLTWSVAGSLQDSTGAAVGGTKTVTGALLSFDLGTTRGKESIEYGGWYFRPWDKNDASDLFQIHARIYANEFLGFQVAYLDTTGSADASSATYHAIFRLDSSSTAPIRGKAWAVQAGIGALQNFTPSRALPGGVVVRDRTTLNLSTFVQASFEVAPRITLNSSLWYIRDRNVDISRFSFGVGYLF